jgi:hypothetical protein
MNSDKDPASDPTWTNESLSLFARRELLLAELERLGARRKAKDPQRPSGAEPASGTPDSEEHAK